MWVLIREHMGQGEELSSFHDHCHGEVNIHLLLVQ